MLHGLEISLVVGGRVDGDLAAVSARCSRSRWRGTGSAAGAAVEALLYVPIVTPEIVVGISLLMLFALLGFPLGLAHHRHRPRRVQHVRSWSIVVLRPARGHGREPRGGRDDPRRRRDHHLPAGDAAAALAGRRRRRAARLHAVVRRLRDHVVRGRARGRRRCPMVVYRWSRRNIEPSINAISTIILVVTTRPDLPCRTGRPDR